MDERMKALYLLVLAGTSLGSGAAEMRDPMRPPQRAPRRAGRAGLFRGLEFDFVGRH